MCFKNFKENLLNRISKLLNHDFLKDSLQNPDLVLSCFSVNCKLPLYDLERC